MERRIMEQSNFTTEEVLTLLSVKGIGNQTVMRLMNHVRKFYDLLDLTEKQFKEISKLKDAENIYHLLHSNCEHLVSKSKEKIDSLQERGIKVISINSDNYPKKYRSLKDAPLLIYCRGNLDLLNWKHSIAVIGTRECSEVGFNIGVKTASYFAARDFNIVSGLAVGIDTSAHIGALKSKGHTTAILVDVDKIYPAENRKLANEILENNGLLLSESEPGSFVSRNMFVLRDRLQSALSDAVFPIETDIKGGTMHTVGYSVEYGVPLYCPNLWDVKGYDTSFSKAQGIIKLIREGTAKPYTSSSYQEIFDALVLTHPSQDHSNTLHETLQIKPFADSEAKELTDTKEERSFEIDSETHKELLFDIDKYTDHNKPQKVKAKRAKKSKSSEQKSSDDTSTNQKLDLI